MRRSIRQVKTFEGTGAVTSFPNVNVRRKQNSTQQELQKAVNYDDQEPAAKRIKLRSNNSSVYNTKKADTSQSIRSNGSTTTPITPTMEVIKKVVSKLRSHAIYLKTRATSQQQDLTLDKDTVEIPNDSKENVDEPYTEEDESLNYLKIRDQNIKANENFFASLGLNEAKQDILQHSTAKKKAQPSQRGLKINKEPKELPPSRCSLRIRQMDPIGNPLPKPDPVSETVEETRLPPGPVPVEECTYSKNEEITPEYVKSISSLICCQKPEIPQISTNSKVFQSALMKATITDRRVAKVVPGRVFSVAWHPSSRSLISVAGDRDGHIGFWDVTASETSDRDVVRAFRPHVKPVTDLFIPPTDPHKLYSCSYDSSLRCCNFEKEVFDLVFSVPEENDDLFRNFSFIDGTSTMLVSQFSGNVSLVDTRTPSISAEHVYAVSKRSLRTVSVHPFQTHYFITAGVDAKIALWDLRSISTKSPKPVQKLEHHMKAISSAYFSPTGHKVLSCAADDTFLIYTVNSGMKLELFKRMRHNNYTGRWLTRFQPNWHPTVEDVFVSGSMHRPRQIEVFSADGDLLKALTNEDCLGSVCSLNAFHPNKTCTLVGANSSGRLHIFM